MTKTLEQLQAEAQAAAEALRAAEQAALEAKREEERAARRKIEEERERAINQQRTAAFAPVLDALLAAGIPGKVNDNNTGIEIPTAEGGWKTIRAGAAMEERTSGTRFYARSTLTGRVLITLSGTTADDRRRFPPLKAGGHNVAKIVATVQEWLAQSQARVQMARTKAQALKKGAELAKQVRLDNGYAPDDESCPIKWQREHSYPKGAGRYEYHVYQPAAGKVFVQVGTLEVTPEQAKILLDAMRVVAALRNVGAEQ